jgi:energy-coupling factor transporter ATP-binding protein EcfA2
VTTAPLVALAGVRYRYPTSRDWVLRGIDLVVERGEYVGLVGTTGAGKSTLCLTLNGLIPHYTGGVMEGEARVAGQDTRRLTVADLSATVGLVFQDADAQLTMSTVEEECLLAPLSQGASRREARARAHTVLTELDALHLRERAPQTLSGGQKQRVAIAAVLTAEPAMLVLDEATSELDALSVQRLFAHCDRLNAEHGTTILLVSHEMELLARHARRLLLLSEGRILLDGPPRAVLGELRAFRRAGVRLPQVAEFADRTRDLLPWREPPLDEAEAEAVLREAARSGPTSGA